jgi:hypothetical protein
MLLQRQTYIWVLGKGYVTGGIVELRALRNIIYITGSRLRVHLTHPVATLTRRLVFGLLTLGDAHHEYVKFSM